MATTTRDLKMLQVYAETHQQAKEQAIISGMNIKDYLQKILDEDRKKMIKKRSS